MTNQPGVLAGAVAGVCGLAAVCGAAYYFSLAGQASAAAKLPVTVAAGSGPPDGSALGGLEGGGTAFVQDNPLRAPARAHPQARAAQVASPSAATRATVAALLRAAPPPAP